MLSDNAHLPLNPPHWQPQETDDGSFTFFSDEFGESFHSCAGAKTEALQKFAQATDLAKLAERGTLRWLDVCYGLGYNTAAALELVWAAQPTCQVELYGLELDPSVPLAAIAPPLLETWSPMVQPVLTEIAQAHRYQSTTLTAQLLLGDARQTVLDLVAQGWQADAIFFDPFSPRCCPQLWTVEFFTQVARLLSPTGKLATYSRSAAVRTAMREAGLHIGTIPLGPNPADYQPHEWSQGTVGSWGATGLHPLSPMEQEHLHTRAAVPYRDPQLNDTAEAIAARHQQEQQTAQCESTSSWRRRWNIR
jgi:tRNA U34 5-methylaminomethyl-2-thiouridine-forming methyltransferase MnmC